MSAALRALEDTLNVVLAAGTMDVNGDFISQKSSLYNYLMMDKHTSKQDGNGKQYKVVVDDENTYAYHSNSVFPTNEIDILNNYTVPYYNMGSNVVFSGPEISLLTGGYSIEDMVGRYGSEPRAPRTNFPTLVNYVEEKLMNVKRSFYKRYSEALYHKQVEKDGAHWVDGLDVIFAAGQPYGGKAENAFGQQQWESLLTSTNPQRHGPLVKDFGGNSFPTFFGDWAAACADISKNRADISGMARDEKLKIYAFCGIGTQNRIEKQFYDQKTGARSSASDTNFGINEPITHDRWGLEIHADHFCPEDRIYIFAEEAIETICQTGSRGRFAFRTGRLAFAQDKIMLPYSVECNIGCSSRWQCVVFTNVDYTYTGDIIGFN